jgi:hypothetical protein
MWDFVVDKVALGQVFSKYFSFPCQSSFHQFLHNHHHLSSGAGTIGQQWPQYQVDCLTPLTIIKNKKNNIMCFAIENPTSCKIRAVIVLHAEEIHH